MCTVVINHTRYVPSKVTFSQPYNVFFTPTLHPSTVTLSPYGDVRVCKGDDQQFMCSSSSFGIWGISGFGSGISDTNSPVSALSYASRNDRVETSDVSLSANPSTLTFHNLGYADHNVVVTCLNATVMGAMTSTIRIGE